MLFVSLLAVIAASVSAIVGYFVFRTMVDPEIIVYCTQKPHFGTIISLVIENMGKGAAKNVQFTSSRPLPNQAWGLSEKNVQEFKAMDTGAIIDGIPFLEPGGKRVITWGQYYGLKHHLEEAGLSVTITYEHKHLGWPFLLKKTGTFPLEIESFAGTDASDNNWDKKAAAHLKDIAASLKKAVQLLNNQR